MLLLTLFSTAFAGQWYKTGETSMFGQTVQNGRDVCGYVSTPDTCGGFPDSVAMNVISATSGTCPTSTYTVECNSVAPQSFDICSTTVSVGMKAQSQSDCELATGTGGAATGSSNYHFLIGEGNNEGLWAQSTGITQQACAENLLPDTCAGVSTDSTVTTLGGLVGNCPAVYTATCSEMSTSEALNSFGVCGTATFSVKFTSNADCNTAAAAATDAATQAQNVNVCDNQDSVLTGMTCADAVAQVGCNAAVQLSCPSSCVDACKDSNSASLTILLSAMTALLFSL